MSEIILYAQPYNPSLDGFFFKSMDEFYEEIEALQIRSGYSEHPEVEIQFIDGETIDAQLFETLSIGLDNLPAYLENIEEWDELDKVKLIIIREENIHDFDIKKNDVQDIELDIYQMESMKDLAFEFVYEGLFGDIPENIKSYIDYDAVANDLEHDYTEITVDGQNYIYRMF